MVKYEKINNLFFLLQHKKCEKRTALYVVFNEVAK